MVLAYCSGFADTREPSKSTLQRPRGPGPGWPSRRRAREAATAEALAGLEHQIRG
ncbi:MAG: hypothetical protein ACRDPD_00070 [Streptosporangiaceae bacterium]